VATTYDGGNVFGYAVKCRMMVNPSAAQVNEFFGVAGKQSLYGGSRGRAFLIEGVFAAEDGNASTLQAYVDLLLSYDDGIGRVLEHDVYGAWGSVVFRRFEPSERILPGPCLPYKAMFEGLY
jgi:hypothetical protein